MCTCVLNCFSHVQLFATLWTVACQLLCPWVYPGKNTGVGCHTLLQGIFPTQGSNMQLLRPPQCRRILYRWATREALFIHASAHYWGLPWWLSGKESSCQCRRHGFNPWVRGIPWRRKPQPSPVFLPGESHGKRSLEGYSPLVMESEHRRSPFCFTM